MENNKDLRTWLDDFKLNHPLVIAGPCSAETEIGTSCRLSARFWAVTMTSSSTPSDVASSSWASARLENVKEISIGITERYEVYLEIDGSIFFFIDMPLVLDGSPDP